MKNLNFKHSLAISTLSAVLLFSGCGSSSSTDSVEASSGKDITLRIGAGHVLENITWTTAMEDYFVAEVDAQASELGYNINWIKTYGGSVAKLGECFEAVESGILDITYVNFGFESSALDIHNLDFRIPFTCPDSTIVSKAGLQLIEQYPEEFIDVFNDYNQTVLGIGVTDNYVIYSKNPINSVADLKGIAVGGGASYMTWLANTGAVAVTASLNDAYTSLQTGVIDANIGPLGASYAVKLHEVAPYVIQTDFGAKFAGALTINNDTLASLPIDLQDIIIEVGEGYSAAEAELTKEKYENDIASLEAEGATIITFTEENKQEWVDLIPDIAQQTIDELNSAGYNSKEIMEQYWSNMSENGYDIQVDWDIK